MAELSLTDDERQKYAKEIIDELKKRGFSISTAESCTGGLLASAFVEIAGASAVFTNGVITYSNEAKIKILNVSKQTLDALGAVSEETAKQMAEGVRKIMNTDIGLSTTGIAGPDGGTDGKPVGLVYIGISINDKTMVKKLNLSGTRTQIRQQSVICILKELEESLKL